MSIKMGYQLSSITPYLDTNEKIIRSFDAIAGIGYRYVQLQGVSYDIQDQVIVKALKDAGLECVATQEDYPLGFGENPDRAILRAVLCGAKYLCCALIPQNVTSFKDLKEFSEKLFIIAEKVKKAGLIFTFHPISTDFNDMQGLRVYEQLLGLLPDDVQLTFCVNAAFAADADLYYVLAKYKGRIDLVHFKDDQIINNEIRQLMPLGQGTHDWRPILSACKHSEVKYIFAEQERWLKDAFDCAKDSFDYLVNLGL